MHKVEVKASRSYTVTVDSSFDNLHEVVKNIAGSGRIAVITDDNVAPLYLQEITALLNDFNIVVHTVAAGEASKSIAVYASLMEELANDGFHRDDTVLTLGGGVVGDLGAFVASTYMRGVKLISVPTTLLSMIDSSVGGKTAVNLTAGKNLCGTFYQPHAVYANVRTLATLPESEIVCGIGELVKYALLDKRITAHDIERYANEEVIAECVKIKRDIVEADEYESGKRMLLNLGHTIGHAVEALSCYTMPHGLCVLKGLMAIARVSDKYFAWSDATRKAVYSLLGKVDADYSIDYPPDEILRTVSLDKKAASTGINTVLIRNVGDCMTVTMSIDRLRSYLVG